MDFSIERKNDFWQVVTSGQAVVETWKAIHASLFSHPEYQPGMNILMDHRQLETHQLTTANIQAIAQISRSRKASFGSGKLAICVSEEVDYGLVRMWQSYSDDELEIQVKIFRDCKSAEQWLTSDHSEQ